MNDAYWVLDSTGVTSVVVGVERKVMAAAAKVAAVI